MRQILVFTALAIAAMFMLTSNATAEPEYENPDLQLKFNWKEEGDMLSPQTKLPSDPEAQKNVQASFPNPRPWGICGAGRVRARVTLGGHSIFGRTSAGWRIPRAWMSTSFDS